MSVAVPPTIAVVLPPREAFGPRRVRGTGLTVRHQALATSGHRTVVYGGRQSSPVFLDVTFRLARPPLFIPGPVLARYEIGRQRAAQFDLPKIGRLVDIPRILRNLGIILILHPPPHQPWARYTQTPPETGYTMRAQIIAEVAARR